MPNINAINRNIDNNSLKLINKLKTSTQIINEDANKICKLPEESEGIFSSWNKQLERNPKTDIFQAKAINTVKINKQKDELKIV